MVRRARLARTDLKGLQRRAPSSSVHRAEAQNSPMPPFQPQPFSSSSGDPSGLTDPGAQHSSFHHPHRTFLPASLQVYGSSSNRPSSSVLDFDLTFSATARRSQADTPTAYQTGVASPPTDDEQMSALADVGINELMLETQSWPMVHTPLLAGAASLTDQELQFYASHMPADSMDYFFLSGEQSWMVPTTRPHQPPALPYTSSAVPRAYRMSRNHQPVLPTVGRSGGQEHQFVLQEPENGYVSSNSEDSVIQPTGSPVAPLTPSAPTMMYTKKNVLRRRRQNVETSSAPKRTVSWPPVDVGAVEALTYYPNHTQTEFILRLLGNGWTEKDIAICQLHARGHLWEETIRTYRNKFRWQALTAGKNKFGKDWSPAANRQDLPSSSDYSVAGYSPRLITGRTAVLHKAARLIDLAKDVINPPSDQDSAYLTLAIQHAVTTADYTLTTDDIPRLVEEESFVMPAGATHPVGETWDHDGRDRVRDAVEDE
ncbi:hypothetical protein LTR53_001850 [Teratosphaeriaceae sp. CCFEE 6253]|nr:hypothetical protein LTR53_001850 [Teratosphaeriaceae sp. CCFEE 6253]